MAYTTAEQAERRELFSRWWRCESCGSRHATAGTCCSLPLTRLEPCPSANEDWHAVTLPATPEISPDSRDCPCRACRDHLWENARHSDPLLTAYGFAGSHDLIFDRLTGRPFPAWAAPPAVARWQGQPMRGRR